MKHLIIYGLGLSLSLYGCINQEPVEIRLHSEECSHCKMVISDRQFASQMVSDKGKAYLFDAVECLAAFADQNPDIEESAAIYLPNYKVPGSWIPLDNAEIFHSPHVKSPMGLSLFTLPEDEDGGDLFSDVHKLDWNETKKMTQEEWNKGQ